MDEMTKKGIAELAPAENGDRLLPFLALHQRPLPAGAETEETIRIERDAQGRIIIATTRKLPNLRFRLGDLLLETAEGVGTAAASLSQPWLIPLAALRFLRNLRDLATLPIHDADAELLITLYRLTREKSPLPIDDLYGSLPDRRKETVNADLERLEKLGCIELTWSGIQFNETILIRGGN